MIKKYPPYPASTLLTVTLLVCMLPGLWAVEGMWLPTELEGLRIEEMQQMGLNLEADEIYRPDGSCLLDAVVYFGGFCTGEVISGGGLVLTNHHCGLSRIQKHSSLDQNYVEEGFWAGSFEEELPNPDLWVRFLRGIEKVTDEVLDTLAADLDEMERMRAVRSKIGLIEAEAEEENDLVAQVKSFHYGDEYYLFLYEEFRDVRLVGAPPKSIGRFGGDLDNWEWPRHSGDFSLFRIYADSNNQAADYAPDNVPYQPDFFLPVSTQGVEEGDFTMVLGYPGKTTQHLLAAELDMIIGQRLPDFIRIRSERLEVIDHEMRRDDQTAIKYASKYSSLANYWKKSKGIIRGFEVSAGIAEQKAMQQEFRTWATLNNGIAYIEAMDSLEALISRESMILTPALYQVEIARGVELLEFATSFRELVKTGMDKKADQEYLQYLVAEARSDAGTFFRDYSRAIDRQVFDRLMRIYAELPSRYIPVSLAGTLQDPGKKLSKCSDKLFNQSLFADSMKLYALLDQFSQKAARRMQMDRAFRYMMEFEAISDRISSEYLDILVPKNRYYRQYLRGLREMKQEQEFFADANSTPRISYGRVENYIPRDAVQYEYQTTLEGIIEKSHRQLDDYSIPEGLKLLYEGKDLGAHEVNGSVPVAFIASNHTTNGNSGSPVLNAEGQLVGINFDRNWEGTMSDYIYDADRCRNIILDIRYVLFIIDKYAGARHLVDEMKLDR